ncbi:MAG: hypothetical protein LBB18_02605 [Puniceicoccales bacterium]|nr:hypothetical protein [Puniceicoccales bacterium]
MHRTQEELRSELYRTQEELHSEQGKLRQENEKLLQENEKLRDDLMREREQSQKEIMEIMDDSVNHNRITALKSSDVNVDEIEKNTKELIAKSPVTDEGLIKELQECMNQT